jgi:hypothetical protein
MALNVVKLETVFPWYLTQKISNSRLIFKTINSDKYQGDALKLEKYI